MWIVYPRLSVCEKIAKFREGRNSQKDGKGKSNASNNEVREHLLKLIVKGCSFGMVWENEVLQMTIMLIILWMRGMNNGLAMILYILCDLQVVQSQTCTQIQSTNQMSTVYSINIYHESWVTHIPYYLPAGYQKNPPVMAPGWTLPLQRLRGPVG